MLYSALRREPVMKLPSRITAVAVLLAPYLLGSFAINGSPAGAGALFRAPATPETLQKHGALKFSVPRSDMIPFADSRGSIAFDYELLGRFASDLGVTLVKRETPSQEAAAELLRSGLVDVAVLPSGAPITTGMIEAETCSTSRDTPAVEFQQGVLRMFTRFDSPELARAMSGLAQNLIALRDDLSATYCAKERGLAEEDRLFPVARLSQYAPVIAKYADAAGLDWRLVAAIIFEESSFEPKAVSAKGAKGLMQLMPATSAEVGFKNVSKPESNIQAGVLYLRRLADQFPDARASDRLAMVLAAYMLGPGHVLDAQELARGLGLSPRRWRRGLEQTLPLLEDERFYGKTRLGYAHGQQAVVYVNRILDRYELYRRHLGRQPDLRASAERGRGAA